MQPALTDGAGASFCTAQHCAWPHEASHGDATQRNVLITPEGVIVRPNFKVKRFRSKAYLDHVRSTPCLRCESPWPSAHHLTHAHGVKARSLKSGDDWAVPLCHVCHMALHAFGDERTWWMILGVDPLEWARTTYEAWRGSKDPPD